MNVIIIDPSKSIQWDQFVLENPFGWICHLSGWRRVLEATFPHIKGQFLAIADSSGLPYAGLPIFSVTSWLTGRRLVSIPFATLCDPLVQSQQEIDALFQASIDLSKAKRFSSIEIRGFLSPLHGLSDQFASSSAYYCHALNLQQKLDDIKKKFDRTCIRQRITRAEKSDLSIRIGSSESDVDKFYNLYIITRKRTGRPLQPSIFLKNLWREFYPSKQVLLMFAEKDGKPLAGLFLLKYKNRVSAEFAASDEKFKSMSPNHFVFWNAIKMAHEEGFSVFDFGRTSPHNKGLMDFKSRWGTEMVPLPTYYYPNSGIPHEKDKESLGRRYVGMLCKISPSWLQKHIGAFCYRHLG